MFYITLVAELIVGVCQEHVALSLVSSGTVVVTYQVIEKNGCIASMARTRSLHRPGFGVQCFTPAMHP